MRCFICPNCGLSRRPYGVPRTERRRPGSGNVRDYKRGIYEYKCPKCGVIVHLKYDYVPELAPVDIAEAWTIDGIAVEVIDKDKSSDERAAPKLKEVTDESGPPSEE